MILQTAWELLLQVTLWSTVGIALLFAVNRWWPERLANLAWRFLLGIIVLTVLVWIPWPRWMAGRLSVAEHTSVPSQPGDAGPVTSSSPGISFSHAWQTWQKWVPAVPSASTSTSAASYTFTWSMALGILAAAGMCLGLWRLLVSYRFVQAQLEASQIISDPLLLEQCSQLVGKLGIQKGVQLRASPILHVAATVGTWQPVILLPHNWTTWNEAECRTVLAHELAHIQRSDYLMMVLTQLIAIIYWFHPLVGWLSRYMRVGQELAADALAVHVLGDRTSYLQCLARLALVQDGVRLPAPARLFLSPEVSLLRRIVMLRDGSRNALASRSAVQYLLVAAVLLAGATIAALRSPVQAEDAIASQSANNTDWQRYIPRNAVGCMVLKPAAALQLDSMKEWTGPLNQLLQQQINLIPNAKGMGIPLETVECFAGALEIKLATEGTPRSLTAGAHIQYLRLRTAEDAETWIKACTLQLEKVESKHGVFYRVTNKVNAGNPTCCLLRPDHRTIVFAESEQQALTWLDPDKNASEQPAWVKACPSETGVLTVCFDTRHELLKKMILQGKEIANPNPVVRPLFDFGGCFTCTVLLNDQLNLLASLHCANAASASTTSKQLDAILNMLKLVQVAGNADRNNENNAANQQLLTELLNNTKTSQKDSTVSIQTECSMKLGEFLKNEIFKGTTIKSEIK